jgi:hypothetical protein
LATKIKHGGAAGIEIGQKEEFLFCLHFIGDKNQTLARRGGGNLHQAKKNKKLFLFCLHFIGEKIKHWHGGAN